MESPDDYTRWIERAARRLRNAYWQSNASAVVGAAE
jgi:hypothetical protein